MIKLYIDDLLIARNALEAISGIKGYLAKMFEFDDSGKAKVFIGLEIVRDRK